MKKKVTTILIYDGGNFDHEIEQAIKAILESRDCIVSYVEVEDIPEGED